MNAYAAIASLRRGHVLAASIPASDEAHLAFVGVYPLDLSRTTTVQFLRNHGIAVLPSVGPVYHIRTFEVERSLIEQDVWIAEPDMSMKRSYIAIGDEALVDRLAEIGLQIEQLDPPWKLDYPI